MGISQLIRSGFQLLFPKLHAGLEQSYFGVFEMNPVWVERRSKRGELQRLVPRYGVAIEERLVNEQRSVFFAASVRTPRSGSAAIRVKHWSGSARRRRSIKSHRTARTPSP